MILNGETVWKFKLKKPKNPVIAWRTKQKNQRTPGEKINMNHVAGNKLTEAKLKKAFRMKVFELCKTRSKKSNPDLFNFYVISAGHDMAIDAGSATTCRRNFKAPWLETERTKNEGRFKKVSFNGKSIWRFQTKNFKNSTPPTENKTKNLKKAFRIKLCELCKATSKKSSPYLFNFYVISANHDMANGAGRATTCRRKFKAPWLQTERTKNEGPSKKMCFNGETVWRFQTKKVQKFHSSQGEQNKRSTTPQGRKLNIKQVATTKLTEAKLKKAFRIKLFELCKTTTKQSSPDLFEFYKISAAHEMVNDAGRARRAEANWRPHDYKQNVQRMKGLLKNWV